MLVTKLCQVPLRSLVSSSLRGASRGSRVTRKTTYSTIKDAAVKPVADDAATTTKAVYALAAGGLIYGMGQWSNGPGAVPGYTLMYFTASLGVTAATAAMLMRSPAVMVYRRKVLAASIIGMIYSGKKARAVPYTEVNKRKLAWLVHSCFIGLLLAPIPHLPGGTQFVRAAWYTAAFLVISTCTFKIE